MMAVKKQEVVLERKVILYPGEDGYIVVECPSLPGCVSQGKTKPQALCNIKEAILCYIESCQKHGEPIPPEVEIEVATVRVAA